MAAGLILILAVSLIVNWVRTTKNREIDMKTMEMKIMKKCKKRVTVNIQVSNQKFRNLFGKFFTACILKVVGR